MLDSELKEKKNDKILTIEVIDAPSNNAAIDYVKYEVHGSFVNFYKLNSDATPWEILYYFSWVEIRFMRLDRLLLMEFENQFLLSKFGNI